VRFLNGSSKANAGATHLNPDSAVHVIIYGSEARAWSSEGIEAQCFKCVFGTRHSVSQSLGTRLIAPLPANLLEAETY
jgi:hypothetical protein